MTTDPHLFSGDTYEPEHDYQRLSTQLANVFKLMADGQWRTLGVIAWEVGGSEGGVHARLRDLRKEKWGSYTVERRRVKQRRVRSGMFEYRLIANTRETHQSHA